MAEVTLQDGETVESALRRFKRKVLQENIIGEVKRHSFYLKPGQKLRVKQALARKRNRKKARREPEWTLSPSRRLRSEAWQNSSHKLAVGPRHSSAG